MTVAIAVGTRFPAFATSMGRVLLASLDEAELDRFFARAELAPLTAATVTSEGALRVVLGRVRDQGWALVDQELEDGLRAVAVPIRDAEAKVVAAVNLSTQANRRTPLMIEQELLPPLLDTSARIERELAAGGYAS
jgi:IclR family pca regulon transcriptional regulator